MNIFGGGADLMATLGLNATAFMAGMGAVELKLSTVVGNIGLMGLAAGLAFVGAGVKSALDYEEALGRVESKIDPLHRDMLPGLDQNFQNIAKGRPYTTPLLVAHAFEEVLAAGVPMNEALVYTDELLKFGTASGEDFHSALLAGKGLMIPYQIHGEKVNKTLGMMLLAMDMGIISVPEFAMHIGKAAPSANRLGVSVEELLSVVGTMPGVFGTPARTLTALGNIMDDLIVPNETLNQAVHDLGYESVESMIAQHGLIDTLAILWRHTDENIGQFHELFSSQQGANLSTMMVTDSYDDLIANTETLSDETGTLDDRFDTVTDNNKARFQAAKEDFMGVAMMLGTQLLPAITTLTERLSDLVQQFTELDPKWQTAIFYGGMLVFGLMALGKILAGLQVVFGIAKLAILGVAGALGSLLIPVLLIGAAIAILYFAWTRDIGGIQTKTREAAAKINEALTNFTEWLYTVRDRVVEFKDDVIQRFVDLRDGIVTSVTEFKDSAIERVTEFKDGIIERFEELRSKVENVLFRIRAPFNNFVNTVLIPLRVWFLLISSVIIATWDTIVDAIAAAFLIIVGIFRGDTALIKETWEAFTSRLKERWGALWEDAKKILREGAAFIAMEVSNLGTRIKELAADMKARVIERITEMKDGAIQRTTEMKDDSIQRVTEMKDRLIERIGELKTETLQRIKDMWEDTKEFFRTGIHDVVEQMRALPGKIKAALGNLKVLLLESGKDIIRGLIDGIKDMAGQAATAAREVIDGAIQAAKNRLGISSPSKVFADIGMNVVEGFAAGLEDMPDYFHTGRLAVTGPGSVRLDGALAPAQSKDRQPLIGKLVVHANGKREGDEAGDAIVRRLRRLGVTG